MCLLETQHIIPISPDSNTRAQSQSMQLAQTSTIFFGSEQKSIWLYSTPSASAASLDRVLKLNATAQPMAALALAVTHEETKHGSLSDKHGWPVSINKCDICSSVCLFQYFMQTSLFRLFHIVLEIFTETLNWFILQISDPLSVFWCALGCDTGCQTFETTARSRLRNKERTLREFLFSYYRNQWCTSPCSKRK